MFGISHFLFLSPPFFNPFGWWLLLFAVPIVILHFWRVRLRRQPVSTLIFWEQVFTEHQLRVFGRRFRHPLSLILSLLFLSLLAGAVLNPVFLPRGQAGRTVIVFDNSASMNAVHDGRSRFETAKKMLTKLLNHGNKHNRIALISAGGEPRVVLGFSALPGTLRKAAETIQPANQPKKLEQAVELARAIARSTGNTTGNTNGGEPRIFVITDGCCESVQSLLAASDLMFFPVGRPVENVAVTRFQPRRPFGDPIGYEVLVELANHCDEPKECRLELTLDGRLIDVRPMVLAANSVETQIFHGQEAQGGILEASLDIEDALPDDNTARAILPARERQKIVLQGESNFFLTSALQSQQNVELVSGGASTSTRETVHVYYQAVPEPLPEGNVFLVDPRGGCDLFTVGEPLESPLIARMEQDSPLLRFVHVNNVLISGAREIQFAENAENIDRPTILAQTAEGNPIFFGWNRQQAGKITVLSADLKQGDLALRAAFPILVSNVLHSFRSGGGEMEETSQAADPPESDLRTAPDGFYGLREAALAEIASIPPIWLLLTLAALGLSLFDWFLYHRRRLR